MRTPSHIIRYATLSRARRGASGFTLIELMIVVAIIGILSSVALAGYNSYIKTSSTAVVNDHYEQAIRAVRWEYATSHAAASSGIPRSVPDAPAGWIALINGNGGRAPGGGPAYLAGAGDAALGAVGVSVSGTWATGDSAVTVTLPAFNSLPGRSETIEM